MIKELFLGTEDPVLKIYENNSIPKNSANLLDEVGSVRKSVPSVVRAEGSLFSIRVISQHLKEMDYPEKSLNSMLKCGTPNGIEIIKNCNCSTEVVECTYSCCLRTCFKCSKKRQRRLRRQLLPKLEALPRNRDADSLYFLTISPKNYENFQDGFKNITKSFSKFLRIKYIQERVKAGIWAVESKTKNRYGEDKGWNIHIHAILYGRRLDNQIRGKCRRCGQNALRFDYESKRFCCKNSNCNSFEVEKYGDSKLVQIFQKCSGFPCNVRISRLNTASFTLNYLLKYISAGQDDFVRVEDIALYIKHTRKRKLINAFGFMKVFLSLKIKEVYLCKKCKSPIKFLWDLQLVMQIRVEAKKLEYLSMLEKERLKNAMRIV